MFIHFKINRRTPFVINHSGAILVEAILAVLILSVCLTVMIRSMVMSAGSLSYTMQYTQAANFLESKMIEKISKAPFVNVQSDQGVGEEPYENLKYSLTVDPTQQTELKRLEELTLSIQWLTSQKQKSIQTSTYILKVNDETIK